MFPFAPIFVCGIVSTVHAIAFDSVVDADTAIDTADVTLIVLVVVWFEFPALSYDSIDQLCIPDANDMLNMYCPDVPDVFVVFAVPSM